MKKSASVFIAVVSTILMCGISLSAQERVYVSTDKNYYVAGENLWCSVHCIDSSTGEYSRLSSVAFLEFHSMEKVEAVVKIALVNGRGCGRLQIPFGFATGNYSIVAYTRCDGGNSKGKFNGKIVTIFNTLLGDKVNGGVEVVEGNASIESGLHPDQAGRGKVAISVVEEGLATERTRRLKIENLHDANLNLSVSVYHVDELDELIGEDGYNAAPLLERKGNFVKTGWLDYSGETIKARISCNDSEKIAPTYVYMSAMGNTDDIYIATADSLGYVTYYTNNISGERDLLFDVQSDTVHAYNVEIVNQEYLHVAEDIPVLKISSLLNDALVARSMNMQIARRFEADTLLDLMEMRNNSFFGAVVPIVYNLDDYTRFPLMEEVVREYVSNLSIRKHDGNTEFRVMWEKSYGNYEPSKGKVLVLLDGVPVMNHSLIVNMDPLLVKQIVIYPRRFALNYFVFDGVVKFNTYKGDMGGLKLGRNVTVLSHDGVQYPLAFTAGKVLDNEKYPNFNGTVYWNPTVELAKGLKFEFDCVKPQYKGKFRVVVEGLDDKGGAVYETLTFDLE